MGSIISTAPKRWLILGYRYRWLHLTTDWLAVNPGRAVDYSLTRSLPLGIQSVVSDFDESFRVNNLKAVKATPVLPPERVRRAIATGVFDGGGRCYPCEQEVQEATNLMLNRIADTY